MVVLDKACEALHIQHDLGCRVLDILVGVCDCGYGRSQDTRHGQDLGISSIAATALRVLGYFDTKGIDHFEQKCKLGE